MAQHIIPTLGEKSPSVFVSKKWRELYRALRNHGDDSRFPLFDKYTNLYTLCCMIGFKEGRRSKLTDRDSLFTLEQLDSDEWTSLICVAWSSENDDMSLFADSKRILGICDEYAESGIEVLVSRHPFCDICSPDGTILTERMHEDFTYDALLNLMALKEEYMNELI